MSVRCKAHSALDPFTEWMMNSKVGAGPLAAEVAQHAASSSSMAKWFSSYQLQPELSPLKDTVYKFRFT